MQEDEKLLIEAFNKGFQKEADPIASGASMAANVGAPAAIGAAEYAKGKDAKSAFDEFRDASASTFGGSLGGMLLGSIGGAIPAYRSAKKLSNPTTKAINDITQKYVTRGGLYGSALGGAAGLARYLLSNDEN
jgi:hypothetical protein